LDVFISILNTLTCQFISTSHGRLEPTMRFKIGNIYIFVCFYFNIDYYDFSIYFYKSWLSRTN